MTRFSILSGKDAGKIAEALGAINDSVSGISEFLLDMIPDGIDYDTLRKYLVRICEEESSGTGVQIYPHFRGEPSSLSRTQINQLILVFNRLLRLIISVSRPTVCHIEIAFRVEEEVSLLVRDNGLAVRAWNRNLNLLKKTVEESGGSFRIRRKLLTGNRIHIRL